MEKFSLANILLKVEEDEFRREVKIIGCKSIFKTAKN